MILHQNSPPPLHLPRLLPSCLLLLFLLSSFTFAFEQCDPKFTEELLRGHNYFRAHHNAGTLSLNASISKWSQSWADYLLTSGTFQHRFSSENLFYQVTSDHQYRLSGDLPVSNWYNELLNYPFFGSEPNLVTLPHWKHLTAMLWAASTDIGVGCSTTVVVDGYGQASRVTLVVVNYWPEGNVVGAFAENVRQPRTAGSYPNGGHQQQNPQQYPNYPPSPGSPIQSKPPQYQSHHLPQPPQQQPQYQQPQQNHPQYQPNPAPNPQPPEYLNIQSDQNPAEYLANPAYPPSITYHKPPPPPTTYQTTTTTPTTTTTTAKPTTTTTSTTRKPYQTSSRKPAYSVPLKPIISSAAAAISSAGSAASATYHHPALPDLQELYDLEEAFSDFDDDRKKSGGAKKSGGGSDEGLLTKTKSNSAKAVRLAEPVKSPSSKVSSETKEK